MNQAMHLTKSEGIPTNDELIKLLRNIFDTDRFGNPRVSNNEILYKGFQLLKKMPLHIEQDILYKRFYRDKEKRFKELISPLLVELPEVSFHMGTKSEAKYIYCGEEPRHEVLLSAYSIMSKTISKELYKEFEHTYPVDQHNYPAVNITWYDAFMFSVWCDSQLPTEAQWENAANGGISDIFPCEESMLTNCAWFSDNSGGKLHKIAQLAPNSYGLYDMNGNIWEWCLDTYSPNFYNYSSKKNPVNEAEATNRVCRGGSFHSFIDMCRNTFRHHEPADFYGYDLGFRLVKH